MIQAVPAIGTPATLPLHMLRAEEQIRTRNGFDEESLSGLAATIKEHGLIQPIVVRPGQEGEFIVIAGERRMLASSMAGLSEVPVLIRDGIDAADLKAVQAIENIQREALTLADTAEGVAELVKHYGNTKAAAAALGKSPAWVSKHVSLTKARKEVRELAIAGTTEDLELLLTLNQLRSLPHSKGLDAFDKLVTGLVDGSTTRAKVRAALAKLKAPTKEQADDSGQDGEGSGENDGTTTASTSITLHLSPALFEKLERLGGTSWIAEQIREAEEGQA